MIRSIFAGVAFSLAAVSAQATELRVLSSWAENHPYTSKIGMVYMDLVSDASDGDMTFSLFGPDAVPSFEQLEPVSKGLFDILVTHPVYHYSDTGIGTAMDATKGDAALRRTSGLYDFVDTSYQMLGLKLLSAPLMGSKGFKYVLRQPITDSPAFQGRKIRGTPSYHPMISALGGTPDNTPPAEIYTALERGIFDGAAFGRVGVKDLKLNEVAPYLASPPFGTVGLMIYMNLDRWNGLSAEDQELLLEQGRKLEMISVESFDRLAEEEDAWLLANGMQLTEFEPADKERLDQLMNDGVWEVAGKRSPEEVAKMREIADKSGL